MRDPMPTAAQAVVLLNMLAGHRFRWSLDACVECWRAGWIHHLHAEHALTPAGRDALARYLTRTFRGPVVVVEEQPAMREDEARAMLAILAWDRDPFSSFDRSKAYDDLGSRSNSEEIIDRLFRAEWIDFFDYPTAAGREALISYLLRDFNA